MSATYGVGCAALSGVIYAGRVSRDGREFTDKTAATGAALAAVADWAEHHHHGECYVRLADGRRMEITVTREDNTDD